MGHVRRLCSRKYFGARIATCDIYGLYSRHTAAIHHLQVGNSLKNFDRLLLRSPLASVKHEIQLCPVLSKKTCVKHLNVLKHILSVTRRDELH